LAAQHLTEREIQPAATNGRSEVNYLKRIQLARSAVEDFDTYPFCLPLIRSLSTVEFDSSVTFFVGANGAGKSTLLEAIAVALGFNAEGGSRNFHFTTRASHSRLHAYLDIARGMRKPRTGYFLRAESFFNVATDVDQLAPTSSPEPMVAVRCTNNPMGNHF
jgi:predicted ATPase